MGRWEKWYQMSQSPGFQKRHFGDDPLEYALILDLPEKKMFPAMKLPKARESVWKRYVQQYGNPEDDMNVTVYMPIRINAVAEAAKVPLSLDYKALREEAKKSKLQDGLFLKFSHVDTILRWGITLLCSRTLSTVMPITDVTLTRICYAVNVWTLPYINPGVSFPLFKDWETMRAVIEGSEDTPTAVLDTLITKICSHLDCETLPAFFKISPKKEILDIGHTIE